MSQEPSYYAIIPASVRYSDKICPNAKLMYGELTALCSKMGYCWATNGYFAKLYSVKSETISEWINGLRKAGFVTVELFPEKGNLRKVRLTELIQPSSEESEDPSPVKTEEVAGKNGGGSSEKTESNSITVSNKKKKKTATKVAHVFEIPSSLKTPEFEKAFDEWISDLKARRKSPTNLALKGHLKALASYAEIGGIEAAIDAIQYSIESAYRKPFQRPSFKRDGKEAKPPVKPKLTQFQQGIQDVRDFIENPACGIDREKIVDFLEGVNPDAFPGYFSTSELKEINILLMERAA
jgi:hypothetical protein